MNQIKEAKTMALSGIDNILSDAFRTADNKIERIESHINALKQTLMLEHILNGKATFSRESGYKFL